MESAQKDFQKCQTASFTNLGLIWSFSFSFFMMLGNITVCGEGDGEAQINEKFLDRINSEQENIN